MLPPSRGKNKRFSVELTAPMTVQLLLQIGTATIAALGAILLCMGGNNHALGYVATFAAVTSVVFTDWLGWFRLHRVVANTVALLAVSWAAIPFLAPSTDEQLLAIANLLIHLQIILLYQSKNHRVYWHLCVLSLLQVVVAAALNPHVEFGALLIVYMFIGLASMTLLFLKHESHRCLSAAFESAAFEKTLAGASPTTRKKISSWAFDLIKAMPGSSYPMAGDQIALKAIHDANSADRMLNWQLARHVLRLGVTTLGVTVVVFFLTPRLGNSQWRSAAQGSQTFVGFNENGVDLDDVTSIRDNLELVMRVQFTTVEASDPYPLRSVPYFRGALLTTYESRHGKWSARNKAKRSSPLWETVPALAEFTETKHGIRQTIRMKGVTEQLRPLFSTYPVYKVNGTRGELRRRVDNGKLALVSSNNTDARWPHLYLALETTAFRNGRQRDIVPFSLRPLLESPDSDGRQVYLDEIENCRAFESTKFPRLAELADSLLDKPGLDRDDRILVAHTLEQFFRYSSEYQYSTELTRSPEQVDPIEHFVSATKTGHCEYFASALAMMLRSQDIPARLVVGYMGGDLNEVGNYYQVRQNNTHAWVEAYLRPADLRDGQLYDYECQDMGAWLRLDPTPALDTDSATVFGVTWIARINHVRDYFQMLWDDYVLGLDPSRQREAIYQPLLARLSNSIRNMLLSTEWREVFANSFSQRIGLGSWENFRARWLHWRAIPFVVGVGLAVRFVHRMLRSPLTWAWTKATGRIRRWRARRAQMRRWRVEFYHRLERILARRGIHRDRCMTQLEFARLATRELQPLADNTELGDTTQHITDTFNRVRFGGQTLNDLEVRELDESLARLEAALGPRRTASP